jgi:hypothetical protein
MFSNNKRKFSDISDNFSHGPTMKSSVKTNVKSSDKKKVNIFHTSTPIFENKEPNNNSFDRLMKDIVDSYKNMI